MKALNINELGMVQGGRKKILMEIGKAIRDSAAYEVTKAVAKRVISAQNKRAAEWKKGKKLTRRGYR